MPVAPGTYNYHLGRWEWVQDPDTLEWRWDRPAGTVAALDLRRFADKASAGVAGGWGFFATDPAAVVDEGVLIANDLSAVPGNAVRRAVETRMGLAAGDLSGGTLLDYLWLMLTSYAARMGIGGLMPTVKGDMQLWLPGHSLVKNERYSNAAHPHVLEQARANFARIAEEGRTRPETLLRMAKKLGVRPQDIAVPSGGATVSSNFNQADSTTVGPGTWTEVLSGWSTENGPTDGNLAKDSNAEGAIRLESDLDSDDHYVQVDIEARADFQFMAVMGRFSASAHTGYEFRVRNQNAQTYQLNSVSAGTPTVFDSVSNEYPVTAAPFTMKLEIDGSSLTGYEAGGIEIGPSTDTGITGNTRTGVSGFHASIDYDNFEAADLAADTSATEKVAATQIGGVQPVQMPVSVVAY